MLKRLASLALSLLICLSLSVNQAKAVDVPEPADPPAQTDVLAPEEPEEPDELDEPDEPDEPGIMPMGEEYPNPAPDKTDDGNT